MAYVVTKDGKKGQIFYGYYRTRTGQRKLAGNFVTEEEALRVATAQEEWDATRGGVDPVTRATVTLEEYAETFLRLHEVSPVTKRGYSSMIDKHLIPVLGKARVAELTREQVREWLTDMKVAGMSPTMQRRCRVCLSAMMSMAVEDGYRNDNPAKGVRTQKQSRKEITVLTVEQYKGLRKQLPTQGAKVFAHLIVSSGMRFGEATALEVRDIDFESGVLSITKAVSDVGAKWHPNGRDRFLLNPFTKTGGHRFLSLDPTTLKLVKAYIEANELEPDDLLFHMDRVVPVNDRSFPVRKDREPLTPERLAELGTFIGVNGLEYNHGTFNGYVTGKCKCDACRQAISEYSAARRAAKRPRTKSGRAIQPRHYSINAQGYLGRDSWRQIWTAAVERADLPFNPTAYQLRHTHASWLVDGGEDVKTVMGRLGHNDLSTTSLYVHKVASDHSAAAIMANLLGDDD